MTKAEQYDWNELEARPKIAWVPINKLKIDHTYQRQKMNEGTILFIARNFDWSAFGAIQVMQRGNDFYITDGQHRYLAALRREDIKSLPCTITQSEGVESEAGVFVISNTRRRPVSAFEKFRAMLAAGDEIHQRINSMLAVYGLYVKQDTGVHCLTFPALLLTTYRIEPGKCEACIVFQRQAIGEKERLHSDVHKGLFHIVTHLKSGNIFDHAERIYTSGGLKELLHSIRSVQAESGNIGLSALITARGILSVVNKNLKRNRVEI